VPAHTATSPTTSTTTRTTRTTRVLMRTLLTALVVAGLLAPSVAAQAITARTFPASIDPYPKHESQSSCLNVEQPGVVAFRSLLRQTHGANTGGILRACHVGARSEHKEGRAYDWMLDASKASDRAKAEQVLTWLLATDVHGNRHAMLRRLGITYIIWDRQIWSVWNRSWQPYSGVSPHTDHIHFSFGWAGARAQTSYFTAPSTVSYQAPGPFTDVSATHRFVTAISWASKRNIVAGHSDGSFRPDHEVTRAQAVTFLWRMMGRPAVSSPHPYRDVPAEATYSAALRWASAAGITATFGREQFVPGAAVSRSEFAALLHTMAGSPAGAPKHRFSDVPARHGAAVSWMTSQQITQGISPELFGSNRTLTRGQTAVFVHRLAGTSAAWSTSVTRPASARL
jgi:hypothetical protein